MDLKFTQTGKYMIAAGCERIGSSEAHSPVLFISVLEDKDWAVHYPVEGSFSKPEEAAAAALHYAIRLITHQIRLNPNKPSGLSRT